MDKKSTLILITILHICILGICILTLYSRMNEETVVAHVPSNSKDSAPETEAETSADIEVETETSVEINTEANTEISAETEAVTESETAAETSAEAVLYTFHYKGTHSSLNMRKSPDMGAAVIGSIPKGGNGDVLELTNDKWALVRYKDKTGYCSMDWIEVTPAEP